MGTGYPVRDEPNEEFIGDHRAGGQQKWRAAHTDLIFRSDSQLRATAEKPGASPQA